uniref:Uncharacterized protein LOC116957969 n=1 Tax=Petromyzon marinus TaxID=7757 RepID=A0AAJ7UHD3_PETMA|nr:uncharacterized protein LOC116957969 [Petromyzon marinus]
MAEVLEPPDKARLKFTARRREEGESPLAFCCSLLELARAAYPDVKGTALDSLVLERLLVLALELGIVMSIGVGAKATSLAVAQNIQARGRATCFRCGQVGHFERGCNNEPGAFSKASPPAGVPPAAEPPRQQASRDASIARPLSPPQGVDVRILVDTGVSATIVPESLPHSVGPLRPVRGVCVAANGGPPPGILEPPGGVLERQRLRDLIVRFADVFSQGKFDLGRTTLLEHHIDTDAELVEAPLADEPSFS